MEELFTKVIDILFQAKQNGVEVILNGDRLQLKVPEGQTIDPDTLNQIKENRSAIIEFLSQDNWKIKADTTNKINVFDRNTVSQIPVSFSQERLWFIDLLEGGLQYHLPAAFLLEGQLDIDALERTFRTIVDRHEVLRTVIVEIDGQRYQQIKPAGAWHLERELDASYEIGSARLKERIKQLSEQPFDLSADDMLRAYVLRLTNGEHILVIVMHHIAADAWSMPVLVNEITNLYLAYSNGVDLQLPVLPLQFADYALWQRDNLQQEQFDEKLRYWEQKLDDVTPLQLPTDANRQQTNSIRGATIDFTIESDLTQALHKLGRQNGATLFMTLLAAFKTLLYRYSGQEDICVGTSIAGRPQQELEKLIGFFVNTLALRDNVDGSISFSKLLSHIKQTTLEAYANQDVPFERVVEATVKERVAGRSPLFQVMLVLGNTPKVPELKLGELKLSGYEYEHTETKFDLTFFVKETTEGLEFAVQYNTGLYSAARMTAMIGHFKTLLANIVAEPDTTVGTLKILTSEQEQQLLTNGRSKCDYPIDETTVSLFYKQAVAKPNTKAVVFEGTSIIYDELNKRSNQLARHLKHYGVKAGSLVPLFIDRGIDMIVALLGIMKAGGAYVPVDTDFPADRVKYMLDDTGSAIVLSNSKNGAKLVDNDIELKILELDELELTLSMESEDDLEILPTPDQLAYVIYTSGSTGRPKGVLIDHKSLVDYVYGLDERTSISKCRTFGLLSTIATDLGNTVLYSSLVYGGTLHVFSKDSVSNIHFLHNYFEDDPIDCIKIVPSHWKALSPATEAPLLPAHLLIFGGEALPVESVAHIRRYSDCRVFNHYGPTETTVGKLLFEVTDVPADNKVIPIGRPFSNTNTYVLSKELQLSPQGIPGELYIGGAGLAIGYHGQDGLTDEKFINDPFVGNNARIYQTGDRVVINAEGYIEYLGRVDDQVKIRGYRVEPGEVSRIIQESQFISQATVLVRDDKQGNKQLVGYIVPSPEFDKAELQTYLKEHLPEYMIPAFLIELTGIPLTANGKIDRKALPDPEVSATAGYTSPRNEQESLLVSIWQDILEVDEIGINDDFFELGGHSLLAVRLISEVRKAFDLELPISEIFDHPTIASLAESFLKQEANNLPAIVVQERPEYIPLSYSQERLWFIDRMEGSVQYHVPAVFDLKGTLDVAALEKAFNEIVDRHEILRTVIREYDNEGYQLVRPKGNWKLKLSDVNALSGTPISKYIKDQIAKPFDLSQDDMLRVELIKINENEHVLILIMHHIASDGSSSAVLVKELIELYNAYTSGRQPKLSPVAIQYADHAIWQRNYLQGETLAGKLSYWKEKLSGVATLQLPTDRPRPLVQTTNGALHEFSIGNELSEQLKTLSRQQGVTLYMTLLSAFKVLLYRYSGQEDICVGSPVANRSQHELEGSIGFFVNTLALRSDVTSEMTFENLLMQVKQTTLEAFQHQDVPFEKVVEAVVKDRDLSRSPLFQMMFVLQNTPAIPEIRLGDLILTQAADNHHTSKFDITLFITESKDGLRAGLEFNTDIYELDTAVRFTEHYQRLLSAIVNDPHTSVGKLEMISELELAKLNTFNATDVTYTKDKNVIDLFEEQAALIPNTVAAVFKDGQLSYQDLNESANKLAKYLQKLGVSSDTLVPICIERGFDMLISIVGVLKAGATYVPIDPDFPQERINYILEDTKASVFISSEKSQTLLSTVTGNIVVVDGKNANAIAKENGNDLNTAISPDQLIYVLYTSGSTGKPKGVMMPHKGMYNLLQWQETQFKSKNRRVLQFAAYTFDVSFQEIFSTLCFGNTLCLIEADSRKDVSELFDHIDKFGITHLFFPFVVLQNIAEHFATEPNRVSSVEEIIIAGEQLKITEEVRDLVKGTGAVIINQYGPTEAHVVTSYTIDNASSAILPPIGKPVSNTQIHILGPGGSQNPIGVPGEICIGGVQVARGYVGQPELTKEKFISDPYSKVAGSTLYRTGDLGRWLADGNIEYLGRSDDQTKIRGYRVELGEIESILVEHPQVKQAVVLALSDDRGQKYLAGYVVIDGVYDRAELESYLRGRLPEYMIPRSWVALDTIPLTANGKTDKRALPLPDISEELSDKYVAPRNATETILATIWQELLRLPQVGIYDNFFELGGHSLLAMRVISRIRQDLGLEIKIRDLFAYPRIADLADKIVVTASAANNFVIGKQDRSEYIPLSYGQERLWFIDRLEGSTQYHLPALLLLEGDLDIMALEASFSEIVDRHEVLRTVIRENEGQGYQKIKPKNPWRLKRTELTSRNEASLLSYVNEAIKVPFDLSADDMLRVELIKIGTDSYALLVVMHHIASDGWSIPILVREFTKLYAAHNLKREAQLPELSIQYADYAIWQRDTLKGDKLAAKLNYWQEKLAGLTTLQLPTDRIRPAVQGNKGAQYSFVIGKELTDAIRALGLQHGATIYMTLLSAFKALLYRYSGQEDICVGSPVANRDSEDIADLIGFFVNTVAFRSQVNGNEPFTALLEQVKQTTLEAYDHQDVPFEKVVEAVVKERDQSRSPLFQVLFVLQNMVHTPELMMGGITVKDGNLNDATAKYDLNLNIEETATGLRANIVYNTELYKADTIVRFSEHYLNLLDSVISDPGKEIDRLTLAGVEELKQLEAFNATDVDYPKGRTIVSLFEEQVAKTPDLIAVVFEGEELSYAELNKRSNQLAHYLQSQGITRETLVPLFLERSFEMLIGILGILKAGGAYVPIDPKYPQDRIDYMLSDTAAKLVLSSSAVSAKLARSGVKVIDLDTEWQLVGDQDNDNLETEIIPEQLAYVIYTSGSTGRPKGVMNQHSGVVNKLIWTQSNIALNETDALLQKTTYCFDVSVWELLWPILRGARLVFARPGAQGDSEYLKAVIAEQNITLLHFVPSMLNAFLLDVEPGNLSGVKHILCSGEALTLAHVKLFREKLPHIELHDQYGPTEAAIEVTYWHDTNKDIELEIKPIGKPAPNVKLHILSSGDQISPIGVPGELCIGGIQVARGYLNLPELTAERFVKDPFSADANARLYRTGDSARWLADGNIEYLGRRDDQVKIRGYRIELGEIESVLSTHPEVKQTVVLARKDEQGQTRLVAYVVTDNYDRTELESYLQERLPEYMVPRLWVQMERIPVTANGKTDKRALPAPDLSGQLQESYVAPRNATEEQLATIWQELLGLPQIGVYDNFFELGGHSLLAMRVISRVRQELGLELKIRDVFAYPRIAELAAQLAGSVTTATTTITRQERPEHIPLSYGQERLWFIDRLEGSVQYHVPALLRLTGEPDVKALETAFRTIVNRHEVLRTVIAEHEGQGYQKIQAKDNWTLKQTKLDTTDGTTFNNYIQAAVQQPFDLSADPMLRAELIQLTQGNYALLVTMHHIAADGWSIPLLVKELTTLYAAHTNNNVPELPELAIQYADHAIWQRNYLQGEVLADKLSYWEEQLSDVAVLQLPTDHGRPAVQGTAGARYNFTISKELSGQLQALSLEQGATLYMTLLAVFKLLLSRYSGQEDICVGTPVANRDREEVAELIGFFVNTLALRSQVKANEPFTTLLEQVKQTTLAAYEHQDVPFEKVVETVVKERDLSRSPLFQVMFALQNMAAVPELVLGDLQISGERIEDLTAKYDLGLDLQETAEGIQVNVEYATDLYEQSTIARLGEHYLNLLAAVIQAPSKATGELMMLSRTEQEQLASFSTPAATAIAAGTITTLFEAQVKRTPEATALVFGNTTLSYRELNSRSNRLARYLQKQGVDKETLVPVLLERGFELVTALLGILKAGGAYVPVDPDYPQERIDHMLADTNAKLVVSTQPISTKLQSDNSHNLQVIALDTDKAIIDKEDSSDLDTTISPEQLAYVIYTSGSTGRPKGVMIEHRSIANYSQGFAGYLKMTGEDIILQQSSISFDTLCEELYPALMTGARIIIVKEGGKDIAALKHFIEEEGVTLLTTTPSVLEHLNRELKLTPNLRWVISGGEVLRPGAIDKIYPAIPVMNGYGPSEGTVCATYYTVDGLSKASLIGKPVINTQVYLLGPGGSPSPIGVAGELCIGGVQVARGYLNLPELTAERFIKDPFSQDKNARLYRTGDSARWLPDGNIEYLGRKDDQVKIRGYRIELGEIESILSDHSQVKQAVVLARKDEQGQTRLVAYVVADNYDRSVLETYLQEQLPEYMVPHLWVSMERIPVTTNGKTDKRALPAPDLSGQLQESYVAPRNTTEEQLAAIWQELLGLPQVGIYDNFFELGGDSILTIQVVSKARKAGLEIQPKDIFQNQVIASLSEAVQKNIAGKIKTEQGLLTGEVDLLPIQQWYLERNEKDISYFNQAVLLTIDKSINVDTLQACIDLIVDQHDALRFIYQEADGIWHQSYGTQKTTVSTKDLSDIDLSILSGEITNCAKEYQQSLSITEGKLFNFVLIKTPESEKFDRLFMVVHHLAIDGVSWRIILEDLNILFDAVTEGVKLDLGSKSSSYRQWASTLNHYGHDQRALAQEKYWEEIVNSYQQLPEDHIFDGDVPVGEMANFKVNLNEEYTLDLVRNISKVYHTEINDILLAALAGTLCGWANKKQVVIGLEGHGRESISEEIDTSRTVGWFTSLYPVNLTGHNEADILIKEVKEELRKVKDKGLGFGVLKYINKTSTLQGNDPWDITFNYLGQLDKTVRSGKWLSEAIEDSGASISSKQSAASKISIDCYVMGGQLVLHWGYSSKHYNEVTINDLALNYIAYLTRLIDHCLEVGKSGSIFTPADYGLGAEISYEQLDKFLNADDSDNIMSF